ncbi:MAG: hypothetical protein Q4D04_03320 [Clostridia bacterium]|nr:hypothetical protein [Clostridia bacterium]
MITIRQDALLLNLLSPGEARYVPRADDRRSWAMLERTLAMQLIERAGKAQKLGIAPLYATRYGQDDYKRAYISRVEALKALVMGTCAQGTAAFVPAMTDLIYDICQQADWSLTDAGNAVPDHNNSTIDIRACETGAVLAFASILCVNQLDAVSPMIVDYILKTLKTRLIDPMINWEGVDWRIDGDCEARAVSALIAVSLIAERDDRRRWLCLRRALSLLDACVKKLPEEGGFLTGLENHIQTTLALDDCFSMLWAASGGAVEMRDEAQFIEMAQSIVDAHIDGEWFINPAGKSARPLFDTDALFRLGVDARLNSLCALASYLRRLRGYDAQFPCDFTMETPPIYQQIINALGRGDLIKEPARVERSLNIVKRDMRLMVGRMDEFYVALSSGTAGCPAVGDFTLFVGDEPGIMSTHQDKPRLASVPTIGGFDQIPEPGCDLDYSEGAGYAMLSMNIAPAYPAKAGVINWQRTVMMARFESSIRLMDVFDLDSPSNVTFRFMFRRVAHAGAGVVEADGLSMRFDPNLSVRLENLAAPGGQILYRLELYTPQPASSGNYSFVFRN